MTFLNPLVSIKPFIYYLDLSMQYWVTHTIGIKCERNNILNIYFLTAILVDTNIVKRPWKCMTWLIFWRSRLKIYFLKLPFINLVYQKMNYTLYELPGADKNNGLMELFWVGHVISTRVSMSNNWVVLELTHKLNCKISFLKSKVPYTLTHQSHISIASPRMPQIEESTMFTIDSIQHTEGNFSTEGRRYVYILNMNNRLIR